jgi:hydrogenase expression/formation protein HypC
LVHVGFALSLIDADEAAVTLEQIKRLGGGTFETELKSFESSAID